MLEKIVITATKDGRTHEFPVTASTWLSDSSHRAALLQQMVSAETQRLEQLGYTIGDTAKATTPSPRAMRQAFIDTQQYNKKRYRRNRGSRRQR